VDFFPFLTVLQWPAEHARVPAEVRTTCLDSADEPLVFGSPQLVLISPTKKNKKNYAVPFMD